MVDRRRQPLLVPHTLNENPDFKPEGLAGYLEFLGLHFNLGITIKDSVNFIPGLGQDVFVALAPYLRHNNPFCDYIKGHDDLHQKCLYMAVLIEKKLKDTGKPFFGVCHAGMGEFVIPIFYSGRLLLGFIVAGPFQVPEQLVKRRINKLHSVYDFREKEALRIYSELERLTLIEWSAIIGMFEIVAGQLSLLHHQNVLSGTYVGTDSFTPADQMILDKILQYIHRNFNKDVSLRHVAEHCNCSPSLISHIFKKTTGLSLPNYVMAVRIREAKRLLIHTNEAITGIALLTGFNDSNYFAKVFKKTTHLTPSEFRRSFRPL